MKALYAIGLAATLAAPLGAQSAGIGWGHYTKGFNLTDAPVAVIDGRLALPEAGKSFLFASHIHNLKANARVQTQLGMEIGKEFHEMLDTGYTTLAAGYRNNHIYSPQRERMHEVYGIIHLANADLTGTWTVPRPGFIFEASYRLPLERRDDNPDARHNILLAAGLADKYFLHDTTYTQYINAQLNTVLRQTKRTELVATIGGQLGINKASQHGFHVGLFVRPRKAKEQL